MPLTNYVTLGRSGLRVSPFCLGAMTFGDDWKWGSSVAESEAILMRFIELGGNFLHDHRRAASGSARPEPGGARRDAHTGARHRARQAVGAHSQLPRRVHAHGDDVFAGGNDGERRTVGEVADGASLGRRTLLSAVFRYVGAGLQTRPRRRV
jgi:hypothetical protein